MRFYASKTNNILNSMPFEPEKYAHALMLNPNYKGVDIPNDTIYMMDSGAFQDVKDDQRLTFANALKRQLDFEKKLGVKAESLVSYDRLVDEQCENGVQFKKRVDDDIGVDYVEETIKASEYFVREREKGLLKNRNLVLSNQGCNVRQYVGCVNNILDIAEPNDIIGIGGFCIMYRSKEYRQDYYEILKHTLPRIAEKGIRRIHIFGMSIFEVLIRTDLMCKKYGIECSYDTSSAERGAVFGRLFDPDKASICNIFYKSEKKNGYEPSRLAHLNIKNITQFWDNWNEMGISDKEYDLPVMETKEKITERPRTWFDEHCEI